MFMHIWILGNQGIIGMVNVDLIMSRFIFQAKEKTMYVICKCLNEQKSVRRFLTDFIDEPWCSKIICIDGGSSDFTVQELKTWGGNKIFVFRHEYLSYYHDAEISQANIAMSYVPNGEIFFFLDFDERCNQELKNFLKDINESKELPEGADLVHVPRRTIEVLRYENSPFAILGEDGWAIESHQIHDFPDFQPRLIRKSFTKHWIQSPHRTLIGWTKNYNLPPELGAHIIHYEKDDFRDREWIERRWLRPSATRSALGLTHDLHEPQPKREFAEAARPEFWKDGK